MAPVVNSSSAAPTKPVFWFIPHTHWEGAVFKTRAEYLDMGLPHILMALRLLKEQLDYRFVLDQVAYVKPFLERYPEEAAAFRKFVSEGRLELVGGMNVMADCNLPCGEAIVRQILYGKGFYHEQFGADITTAWQLDTFGHNAQMPQILTRSGFKSMWFYRGVPHRNLPSEFYWQGLDGTRLAAYWLPFSYGFMYETPKQLDGFAKSCTERFAQLAPHARGTDRVGLAGIDVCPPEAHVAPLVAEFNRQPAAPFVLRLATPSDYEAAVARQVDERPTISGELNPIFQGSYSSRIEIKQWIRSIERLLLTAEQWAVVAHWLAAPADNAGLWRAWEPVLFNEAHDLAAGVMTDHVYADTIRGYQFAKRTADELLDESWRHIAAHIDTRGPGVPVVVWNTLGWPRTDVAEMEVSFTEGGVTGVDVRDPEGCSIPVQLVETWRYADGSPRQARIAFLAHDVPALGYAVYHIVAQRGGDPSAIPTDAANVSGPRVPMDDRGGVTNNPSTTDRPAQHTGEPVTAPTILENGHYRLALDAGTGAIKGLWNKIDQWEALAGPANVVTCEPDNGDLWELYVGLDGYSNVAMTRKQPVPQPGQARFSNQESGSASTRHGAVFSEYHAAHPFGNGTFATTIRLYHGLPRIDVRTELVNNDRSVRYQALFPTTIKNGHSVHEIPFGAIERPAAIEFPAQTWVDYSDGRHGFALLNEGLPGNVVTDGTLMLSLLRSHTLGAYSYIGGYEPGVSSESGLQLGRQFALHYALVAHAGDWRSAQIWREGQAFNQPLICHKAIPHDGRLPPRFGALEVSPSNVVLSALKPGPDGTAVLRVYEAAGRTTAEAMIKFQIPVAEAQETDLLEKSLQPLKLDNNTLRFELGAFEIKTFKLTLRPGGRKKS